MHPAIVLTINVEEGNVYVTLIDSRSIGGKGVEDCCIRGHLVHSRARGKTLKNKGKNSKIKDYGLVLSPRGAFSDQGNFGFYVEIKAKSICYSPLNILIRRILS